ncbi:hypothetical protein AURDEDRAFT_140797 [Auricularia subglabra TFB-10046 SS5]|nr:hypothetical protein AURDEDRAFT_140797 [Auricularia subglabra TFB-10046 SS5]
MSSAAERAKARREALLNRGSDRLAKLTTSARGGEDTTYLRHDVPLVPSLGPSLTNFLGEDSGASTPVPPSTPQRRPLRAESASPAHLQAPSAANAGIPRSTSMPPTVSLAAREPLTPPPTREDFASGLPPGMALPPLFEQILAGAVGGGAGGGGPGDPFAALLQGMPQMAQDAQTQAPQPRRTRTFSQRLLGVLRLVAVILLVGWSVYWQRLHSASWEQRARAWGDLNQKRDDREVLMLPTMFFWTFLTLLIGQHAFRILDDNEPVSLPTLVSIALPHLPAPLPSIIVNGARYYSLLSLVLDDIAALVFALGVVVWWNGL